MSVKVELSCAECGIEIVISDLYEKRMRSESRTFYCPNGHGNVFKKNPTPPPLPKIVEKIVIRKEKYRPKNFEEMLNIHEHTFITKTKGQKACSICGLYEAVFSILKN